MIIPGIMASGRRARADGGGGPSLQTPIEPLWPTEVLLLQGLDSSPSGTFTFINDEANSVQLEPLGDAVVTTSGTKFGAGALQVNLDPEVTLNTGAKYIIGALDSVPAKQAAALRGASTVRFHFKRDTGLGTPPGPDWLWETLLSNYRSDVAARSWFLAINAFSSDIALAVSTNGSVSGRSTIKANVGGRQNDGNWHEYAFTHDGAGTWALYFDGEKLGQSELGVPFFNEDVSPSELLIARLYNIQEANTGGVFDEIRVSRIVEFTGDYEVQTAKFPRS